MTIQDWTNKADYEYTASLDNAGWAWEFLRRSEHYRAAYASGDVGQCIHWTLKALYSPDEVFHDGIQFQYSSQFPAFFGSPGGPWDYLTKEQLANFPEIHRVENATDIIPNVSGDVIFVAFDTSLPLKHQLKIAQDTLTRYQDGRPHVQNVKGSSPQEAWQRQLRMLDAVRALGKSLPHAKIIQIIHPDKSWPSFEDTGSDGEAQPGDKEANGYAHDVLTQARFMADEGYQKFLLRLATGV